jgi:hypothetical protein
MVGWGHSEIPIPCVAKAQPWLKPGETVLVKGELQRRPSRVSPRHDGSLEVYCYQIEQLSASAKGKR